MSMSTTSNEFANIPLAQLAASLTNPRTSFNPARLQELADSIRASGVHQPILVRPLPGARVGDTEREVQFEIVAGERRFRACQIAGAPTIPAMVRAMTDGEVLEVQIVENLQRDDLTELEEAEGYERLMAHSSLTAEEVGSKIGKSRSTIYARLKLLDLSMECKEAMRAGQIDASRALLIARIPDTTLQTKALAEATKADWRGEVCSVRALQSWLQANVMLRLENASFRITDSTLVKSAGSCKDCPKRTGANPDLFADVDGADICTDPICYHGKEDAQRASMLATAAAKGMRLIEGTEAKEICHQYRDTLKGYSPLSQVRNDLVGEEEVQLGTMLGKDSPPAVLIENPWTKELIAAVPTEEAEAVLVAKGLIKAGVQDTTLADRAEDEIDRLKKSAAKDIDRAARKSTFDALVQAVRSTPDKDAAGLISSALLRAWLIHMINEWKTESLALALGIQLPEAGTQDEQDTRLRLHIQACDSATLFRALAIFMIEDDARTYYSYHDEPRASTLFEPLAKQCSVDLAAIKAEATASVKAETAEKIRKLKAELKPKKPLATTTPLAQPPVLPVAGANPLNPAKPAKAAPRKARLSPEEAQSGIAAALQKLEAEPGGSEAAPAADPAPAQAERPQVNPAQAAQAGFAIGQYVRVKADANSRFAGKKGEVVARVLGQWSVELVGNKGRNGGIRSFDASELEVVS